MCALISHRDPFQNLAFRRKIKFKIDFFSALIPFRGCLLSKDYVLGKPKTDPQGTCTVKLKMFWSEEVRFFVIKELNIRNRKSN